MGITQPSDIKITTINIKYDAFCLELLLCNKIDITRNKIALMAYRLPVTLHKIFKNMKKISLFSLPFIITFVVSTHNLHGKSFNKDLLFEKVVTWSTAEDGQGMVHSMGLVVNQSTTKSYRLKVKVFYLDDKGNKLKVGGFLSEHRSDMSQSEADKYYDLADLTTIVIEPNSKSYFHQYRSRNKLPKNFKNIKVEFDQILEVMSKKTIAIKDLKVSPDKTVANIWDGTKKTYDDGVIVEGDIVNEGNGIIKKPSIAIVYFDKKGNIIGDRVIETELYVQQNKEEISVLGPLKGNAHCHFKLYCNHPMQKLSGDKSKIATVEVYAFDNAAFE